MTAVRADVLRGDPAVRSVAVDAPSAFRAGPSRARLVGCKESMGARQCLPDWADRVDAERSSARSGDGHGSLGSTGNQVNVAVLDSGIDGGQPDLNVRGGGDCLGGSPVVPGASLTDGDRHGTETSGIVGAEDNGIDVVGIAPGMPGSSWRARPSA
ncbi:hypothetical protein Sros01_79680 [Streptomyces roseochromogenus]|nr:hypothetical protein Sros01_79680 [Streptomyces roseochromogenus]